MKKQKGGRGGKEKENRKKKGGKEGDRKVRNKKGEMGRP